jgi:hypothetical protein
MLAVSRPHPYPDAGADWVDDTKAKSRTKTPADPLVRFGLVAVVIMAMVWVAWLFR